MLWWSRRCSVLMLIVIGAVFLAAPPAAAHDPVFIADDQTTPDTGPYFPDATVSWALYGTLRSDGDVRGFEFDIEDGQDLLLSLLIPDADPERLLADEELPRLEVTAPDGTVREIRATDRTPFFEPFSTTSYINLHEERGPAAGGRYQVRIIGTAPARFTVAIGFREVFGTPAERAGDRSSFRGRLSDWYTTPPETVATTATATPADASADEPAEVADLLLDEESPTRVSSATTTANPSATTDPVTPADAVTSADAVPPANPGNAAAASIDTEAATDQAASVVDSPADDRRLPSWSIVAISAVLTLAVVGIFTWRRSPERAD